MASSPATVKVSRRAAERLRSGHPWVFASDVLDVGSASRGSVVSVVDPADRNLGTAHYSSSSQISLRLLSRKAEFLDQAFYLDRLRTALHHRRRVVQDTNAFRLVHGEADQLPGLVVDIYADSVVLQTLTQGMDAALPLIIESVQLLLQPTSIVLRNDVAVRSKESLPLDKRVAFGPDPGAVPIRMNGFDWEADLLAGQKTGIYLDQRENYSAVEKVAFGQALDCFTSTGGFALHMARTCQSVEGVDSSESALQTASGNARRNGIENVRWREADVFDLLAQYAQGRRKFDTVVLDPPAFTKSRGTIDVAVRGYREINQRALRLLSRGGILVTCSCSHHLSEALLLETIAQAALDADRQLRVLERRFQAQDHPILLAVPETLYLKCIVLEVV